MKKLLALLLAAVMCVSLAACGGGTPNNDKTQTNENTGFIESENTVSADDDTQLDNSSKFIPYMCGEWKVLDIEDEGVLDSVIITEDGNINIDGSNFKWELQNERENAASCKIIDGESVAGSFNFGIEDNGDIRLSLSGITDSEISLYKPEHYEVITITTDNVYEYFEFRDFWQESTNAFGELTSVRIDTKLVLKDEYYSRLSQRLMDGVFSETVVENGAIEWHYKRSGLDVVVNLDDKTYTFENFESGTEDTETGVQGFVCNDEYAGFWARFLLLTPDSEGRYTYTWACVYEMEITRLELDLYLIAETN